MSDQPVPSWRKVLLSGSNAAVHELTASGLTLDATTTNRVVMYDTTSGVFYYTGSYGGSGGEGTPSAPNQSIQYNNEGAFGGDSGFIFNDAADASLYVAGPITGSNISGSGNISGSIIVATDKLKLAKTQYPVNITQNSVGGAATMEFTTTDISDAQATRLLIRGNGDNADIEFYTGASGSEALIGSWAGDSGTFAVGDFGTGGTLDTNVSKAKLIVDGNISTTGSNGHITSSGNISSSLNIYAQKFSVDNNVFADYNSGKILIGDAGATIPLQLLGSSVTITPALTASIVSASSNMYASTADAAGATYNTLMVDTATGKFYHTGSYGGGGGEGTPGGSNTYVQFNDGGSFGGDDAFTFLTSSHGLRLGNNTSTYGGLAIYGDTTTNQTVVLGGNTGEYFLAPNNILIGAQPAAPIPQKLTIEGGISASGNIYLENAQYFAGSQAGGTTRNLLGIDSSDITQIGNANIPTNIKGTSITASGEFKVTGETLTVINSTLPKIRLIDTSNNYYTDLVQSNVNSGIELKGSANQDFYISTNYFAGTTRASAPLYIDGGNGEITFNEGLVSISSTGIISASTDISASGFYGKAGNFVTNVTSPIISASTELGTDADIYAPNLPAGVDNTVVIKDSDGYLRTDEIDPRVWDGTLIDVSGTPSTSWIPRFSDANTVTSDNTLAFTGDTLRIGGKAGLSATHVLYMPPILGSTTTTYKSGIEVNASDFSAEGHSTGEIFNAVNGASLTRTEIVYYGKAGAWVVADATTVAPASGMLGLVINTGTSQTAALTKGYMAVAGSQIGGTYNTGSALYLGTSSGMFQTSAPGKAGHTIRKVGWVVNPGIGKTGTDVLVHFNPSSDFITN